MTKINNLAIPGGGVSGPPVPPSGSAHDVSAAYRSRIYDNVDTPRPEPYQFVQATYVLVCSTYV